MAQSKHVIGQRTGTLKKILDYVASRKILSNLALANMSLILSEDVTQVSYLTPDDPERIARYVEAAKLVLRTDKLDLDL